MREIVLLQEPIEFEFGPAIAIIIDYKEKMIKYVVVKDTNAGYHIYDQSGQYLAGEEYRP